MRVIGTLLQGVSLEHRRRVAQRVTGKGNEGNVLCLVTQQLADFFELLGDQRTGVVATGEDHVEQHYAVLQRIAVEAQGLAVLILQRRVGEPGFRVVGAFGRRGSHSGLRLRDVAFVSERDVAENPETHGQGDPVERSHGCCSMAMAVCLAWVRRPLSFSTSLASSAGSVKP
ncbi:hypothetical protein D3C81_1725610 [compost metagenome]